MNPPPCSLLMMPDVLWVAILTHLLGRVFAEVFEVHVAQRTRDREPPVYPVVGDEAASLQGHEIAAPQRCDAPRLRDHMAAFCFPPSSRLVF